jgi:hypothetical protein
MKKRLDTRVTNFLGLMLAVVALALIPAQARAVDCTAPSPQADFDNDGVTDEEECLGLSTAEGAALDFPSCVDTGLERADCLDPATQDLFAILVQAEASNFPDNPLEFVSKPLADGGLGLTTHEVSLDDRNITPSQKAVRITESLISDCGNVLGFANLGLTFDEATIYTDRILCFVSEVYSDAGATAPADIEDSVINPIIRWVIAHEVGHVLQLSPEYNSRFGGNHFRSGSRVIMEQIFKYSTKKNTVTFSIADEFSSASQDAAALN